MAAEGTAGAHAGDPRTPGVTATLDFIRDPTARTWYRAHNTSIASAYLAHEDLARAEGRVERFFIICSTPAHPPPPTRGTPTTQPSGTRRPRASRGWPGRPFPPASAV